MHKGTTPKHTFKIPFKTETIAILRVTYAQRDEIVVEKTEADCTLEGDEIIVKLSQEETLSFDENEFVKIQIRIITTDGEALVSNKIRLSVGDVLNKEVLV